MTAQTHLAETEDLWRLTMEHSPVGMAIVSPAGAFLTVNAALCDMLGHEPDVLATLDVQSVTHSDDLASDLRLLHRTIAGDISSYRITKRFIRADGAVVIGDLSVALLRAPDGSPVHFIFQVADITERHAFVERLDAAEAAVEAEQRRTEALFESVAVGLLQVDADGAYLAFNNRLSDILDLVYPRGHDGHAGPGAFAYDLDLRRLPVDELPTVRAARGEQFDDVLLWVGEDPDSRRALSVSARPVRDRFGRLSGAVVAHQDVTDLLRAVRAKDDFVATVSHELRTPLTSALAYLELLDDSGDVTAEGHQQVGAARRNMLRLSHLVADLLLAARVSAGSSVVDPYRLDVAAVLTEAVEAAGLDASGSGVRVEWHGPSSLVAVADGMRLRQVLDNLLANAIAYSRAGDLVRVTLSEDRGQVVLTVVDEGVGIDLLDVADVFTRFFRGANSRRLRVPGAGLGLHTVRTIVEAHAGEVSLDSAPGAGTTVRVALPR
ncbi:hypothetical protein GCM10009641_46540 [Mycobacterium cookii]|uniref:Sensor-like histidine kinase SenX3 n=1 Tax=Nocardioides furvisabuli TaxID=375542 RepID=A0ABP5JE79_9ACTN|nr:PAS domain-containing sensor histidine kinase [Nocardioides furvisabuli]